MRSIWNIFKHKYLKIPAVVVAILIIALPVFIFVNQQNQDNRTKASEISTFSFAPSGAQSSPLLVATNDDFYLDIMIDPDDHWISEIQLDIIYDETKVKLSNTNPIIINESIFSEIIEGPIYSPGRVQITVSVGEDLSKSISNKVKGVTLNFTAQEETETTQIIFGRGTSATSIDNENVPGFNTTPAYITIE